MRNGHGILKRAGGDIYEALIKDGNLYVKRFLRFANGNIYEALFKDANLYVKRFLKLANGD